MIFNNNGVDNNGIINFNSNLFPFKLREPIKAKANRFLLAATKVIIISNSNKADNSGIINPSSNLSLFKLREFIKVKANCFLLAAAKIIIIFNNNKANSNEIISISNNNNMPGSNLTLYIINLAIFIYIKIFF